MPDLFTNTITKTKLDHQENDFLSTGLKAKEILPQIDWVVTQRKVEYINDLLLLQNHSSIQVRRKVATGLGLIASKSILEQLKKWQVHEGDRQTWLLLESTVDKLSRKFNPEESVDIHILTVSEAIGQIKNQISQKTYIIEGELSEVRPVNQMYYFSIKDREDTKLDCLAFAGKIIKAGFPLNEGLAVRVTGKFKLSKSSKLYFDLEKIELTGEGELLRNLKLLEQKLKQEGLFDTERKRQLKTLPKKILLLASPSSAAFGDFQKVLARRIGGIEIYLLPIKTQGIGAEFELLESLDLANKLTQKYSIDTIVITRGGGSKDDLIVFNSEKVVRKIHSLNKPSIVAIGHERDVTLAELVADVRASTPSQAAELVSSSREEILNELSSLINFFQSYFYRRREEYQLATTRLLQVIFIRIKNQIENSRSLVREVDKFISSLIYEIKKTIQTSWQSSIRLVGQRIYENNLSLGRISNLEFSLTQRIQEIKIQSKFSWQTLEAFFQKNFSQYKSEFSLTIEQIKAKDPKKILAQGFAIIWQDGKVVSTKLQFKKNKQTEIEFDDGKLEFN